MRKIVQQLQVFKRRPVSREERPHSLENSMDEAGLANMHIVDKGSSNRGDPKWQIVTPSMRNESGPAEVHHHRHRLLM